MMKLKNLLKRLVKAMFRVGLNFVIGHKKFRLYITAVFRKLGLDGVAQSVYKRLKPDAYSIEKEFTPKDASHLSPRAQHIYTELKAAIEHRQRERL